MPEKDNVSGYTRVTLNTDLPVAPLVFTVNMILI